MKRYPRILFFIKGTLPSAEAMEVAEKYGPNVAFRNANFVPSSGAIEKCDGVAGEVPETYKELPTAEEALKKFEEDRKAAAETANKNKAKREAGAKAEADGKDKTEAPKTEPAKPDGKGKAASWKPNA